MSINMINSNQGVTQKIIQLNQMILELNGMVAEAQFNKNELDALYSIIGVSRQYLRNQGLGNTVGTYTGWTDINDQQGYSIWSYTPTKYLYNALNQVYLNGQLFTNRGQAYSQSATAFANVFLYEADSYPGYVNEVNAGQTNLSTSFYTLASTLDYLYLGSATTFGGYNINWKSRGGGYTLVVQYWNGSAWTTMGPANSLTDDTNSWQSNGTMTWTIPANWATTAVNGQTKYWIRISTSTNPVAIGNAYYCIPATSVIGLLSLSSSDITNANWCWCSYNGNVYVTLPNSGGFNGLGSAYITGSASAANLQNFFIYNNPITADYATTAYSSSAAICLNPGGGNVGIGTSSPQYSLDINTATGLLIRNTDYNFSNTGSALFIYPYATSGNINYVLQVNNTGGSSAGNLLLNPNGDGDAYSNAWSDYSASSTINGWVSISSKAIYTKKIGKTVFVNFNITGTSNATSVTFTVPYSAYNGYSQNFMVMVQDNSGAISPGLLIATSNSTSMAVYNGLAGGSLFTASGTKTVSGYFSYQSA